ncbi:hypothetical protein [Streptomyces sp. fd1-xmd]|uniref:hypothetical protein n=1 Tax=Streptomyces sp. fd1-xmd TaxID=1812480 RepID=UPI0009909F77|nr:hypothetical protein [Streptomyces sp. fd1-xmd]AQT70362.1 hypothetical protein B1K54_00040 [Streptomyces sp. fd1-xmd]
MLDSRATAMTTATGLEWQLAAAAGGALREVAVLAAALQEGRWPDARQAVTDLREVLARLDALLPSGQDQALPASERLAALLEAAGHPLALVRTLLERGSIDDLHAQAQDQVRADLKEFARTVGGRDELLRRAGRLGLSESETARAAGVSRTTVRTVAGKGAVRSGGLELPAQATDGERGRERWTGR